jgi:hypothetical protein
MTIRDNAVPSCVSYRDLSIEERDLYIPKAATIGALQISYNYVYVEWVSVDDLLYHGKLTYVPSCDKDIHMMDENGHKYRYGMEHFRRLIPHIRNGVVDGSFKYVGRGSRQIKYILVPCDNKSSNNLIVCDSSESESESELGLGPEYSRD